MFVMFSEGKDLPIRKGVVKVTVGVGGSSSTAVEVKQEPDSGEEYGKVLFTSF